MNASPYSSVAEPTEPITRYLRPGLERGAAVQVERAHHVQRDRQQLDAEEQRDEVRGAGQHDHAGDAREQQRGVVAEARVARAGRSRSESTSATAAAA